MACSGACLRLYALFDRDPPFTTKQLEALVTPDIFEVIDWPGIFRRTGDAASQTRSNRPFAIRSIPRSSWSSDMSRVVVIGAGAMGLAAAYQRSSAATT